MSERTQSLGLARALYEEVAMVLGLGFLALQCLIWLPVALILKPLLPRALGIRVGRLGIYWGARIYLRFLSIACGCRFDLKGLDGLASESPMVLAANHPSLIDILLLVSRVPNATCVMKATLMDNLLFGAAARLAGYVPNEGPLEVVLGACHALEQGGHLILFPEATRTRDFPLDEVSESAALIAQRVNVPIQTLLVAFSSPYLGKEWPLWRRPILPLSFSIQRGRRLVPGSDSDLLTRDLEGALRQGLAQLGVCAPIEVPAESPGALT